MNEGQVILLIVGVACAFGLFLLFRELINWYFRINERTKLAKEQLNISIEILNALRDKEKVIQ